MHTPHQIEYILDIVATQFPAKGIKAFLIGGLAVNHLGYARNTLDVGVEQVLRPLCEKYGAPDVHDDVVELMRELVSDA